MRSLTKNMSISIVARIVTLVTGLIVQREILLAYGSTFNGLTSSITQVMSYLVLLEAGLGTASIQALYHPLAANDWNDVSGIISATDREYRKISAVFFGLLLLISIVFPLVVSDQIEYWISSLMMLLIGGSYIVSYILGGKYKALLSADRKMYILYILDIITITLSCVLRIAALRMGYNIVFVQFLNLICAVIKNAGYVVYVRHKYRNINYRAVPNLKAVSKRWNVLIHSLAGIVVNHTDILILTVFANLKLVSVYSVYNMVFSQLSSLLQSTFLVAPQANFGRIYNADFRKFERAYKVYETLFEIILHSIVTIALIMILPFVRIYTHGVDDINYTMPALPILFALILLLNQMRVPMVMVINIVGDFKETQKGAIIEAIINLLVSLCLFFFSSMGLYGLLVGTICSYLYRTTDLVIYTYMHYFRDELGRFVKSLICNLLTLSVLCYVFYVWWPVTCATVGMWIISAMIISVIVVFTFIATNFAANKSLMQQIVVGLWKKFVG